MATLVDYVRRMQQTFAERPFATEDSLVLSQLAYLHMPPCVPRAVIEGQGGTGERTAGRVPAPAGILPQRDPALWRAPSPLPVTLGSLNRAEWLPLMTGSHDPHGIINRLTEAAMASRRFRDVRVANAIEPTDVRDSTRFSALTYDLGDGTLYVCFRGTDGTFAGWHEDYRLLFTVPPLPSQALAARYAAMVLEGWKGAIIVGGHSMGGNLAAYVAAAAPLQAQNRILAVYGHDSPGFIPSFIATPGFRRIRSRIHKTVPESSIIGMLFDSGVEETIVRSSAHGIRQHHMTSWVLDDDTLALVRSPRLNAYSRAFAGTLNNWRENVSIAGREHFIDDLFAALDQTGVHDFPTLLAHRRETLPRFREAIHNLPDEEQKQLRDTLSALTDVLLGRASKSTGDGDADDR